MILIVFVAAKRRFTLLCEMVSNAVRPVAQMHVDQTGEELETERISSFGSKHEKKCGPSSQASSKAKADQRAAAGAIGSAIDGYGS